MNLIDMVKGQLTEAVVQKLGSAVGLGGEQTSKALEAIVPAQFDALLKAGANPTGAQGLIDMASKFTNLGNLGDLLGKSDGPQSLLKMGESVLPMLFGNRLGSVESALASHTGVSGGAISGLMKLAGPVIMGVLGSQIKTQGLNPMGLVSMLGGLKGPLGAMLPAGLSKVLDLGGIAGMAGAAGSVASAAAPTAKAGMPWLIPTLAVLLLGGGLAWFFGRPQAPAPTPVTTEAPAAPVTETPAAPETPAATGAGVASCDKSYTVSVTEGQTVTQPFRFGGEGKGRGYEITIKRGERLIGTKQLTTDTSCSWGYESKPGVGPITYEVREIGSSTVVSTVNLTVQ
jgi:hypothetical protein